MTHPLIFDARSPEDTDRLGAALAEVLPQPLVVELRGTLGAGKTRLVEAVAAACGVPRAEVVSPTFVLIGQYHGRRTIYHMDAYRIADDDEFLELGPEEYFAAAALTFVEWGERVARCLPPDRLVIEIEVVGERARQFRMGAIGKLDTASLKALQGLLA